LSKERGFKAWFSSLSEASKVGFIIAIITVSGTLLAAVIGGGVAVYTATRSNASSASSTTPAIQPSTGSISPEPALPSDVPSTSSSPEAFPASTSSTTSAISGTQETPATEDLKFQSVSLELSDTYKAGAGLYKLDGRKTINLRFWWTTATNYGPVDPGDKSCTVVATMISKPSGHVVDTYRTPNCSFSGWVEMFAPQGMQEITVDVTLANGSHGKGVESFRVIP
jgi:hypothetical protein